MNCHFCAGRLTPIGPEEHSCRTCGASYAGSATMAVVQFLALLCPACGALGLGGELGKPLECDACGRQWTVCWDGTLSTRESGPLGGR